MHQNVISLYLRTKLRERGKKKKQIDWLKDGVAKIQFLL